MTSSIGLAAAAAPFKPQIFPVSELTGSTSGVGGMTSQSYGRYQAEPTHHFQYQPGSCRFKIPGRGNVSEAKGTWGMAVYSKFNMIKQKSGISGYMNQHPISRPKKTQMVLANLGRNPINPNLPRGGNVMRIFGTEKSEDPQSFKSNFNYGNFYNENPAEGELRSGNDMQAPLPETITKEIARQIIPDNKPNIKGLGAVAKGEMVQNYLDAERVRNMPSPPGVGKLELDMLQPPDTDLGVSPKMGGEGFEELKALFAGSPYRVLAPTNYRGSKKRFDMFVTEYTKAIKEGDVEHAATLLGMFWPQIFGKYKQELIVQVLENII